MLLRVAERVEESSTAFRVSLNGTPLDGPRTLAAFGVRPGALVDGVRRLAGGGRWNTTTPTIDMPAPELVQWLLPHGWQQPVP